MIGSFALLRMTNQCLMFVVFAESLRQKIIKNKKILYTGKTLPEETLQRLIPHFKSGSVKEMQTGRDSAWDESDFRN